MLYPLSYEGEGEACAVCCAELPAGPQSWHLGGYRSPGWAVSGPEFGTIGPDQAPLPNDGALTSTPFGIKGP